MFPMPPGPEERWEEGDVLTMPRFDLSYEQSMITSSWQHKPMRSAVPFSKGFFTLGCRYDLVETVTDEEFERRSGWPLDWKQKQQ
jgi:hypothetical protein